MPGYKVIAAQGTKTGLLCPECNLILKEAVQTPEGIRLCESCYKAIESEDKYTSKRTGITVVDDDGKPSCFPDKAVRRDVDHLEVQCNNWKLGCKWVGQLAKYFQAHEPECLFKPIPCPQCNENVLEDELKRHLHLECRLRTVSCEHCRDPVLYDQLQKHYKEYCGKFPLQCEHCGQQVPRNKMGDHKLKECEMMQCTCGELLNRNTHEDDPKSVVSHLKSPAVLLTHLLTVFSLGQDIVKRFKLFDGRLTTVESMTKNGIHPSNSHNLPQDWSRFRRDIEKRFRELIERMTPLQEYHITSTKENLSSKVQDLHTQINKLEERNSKQDIEIERLISRLNHQELRSSRNQISATRVQSQLYSSSERQRLSHLERKHEDMERQVTMLKVHISEMELQLQASIASTYNGSFMWRIPDFHKRKQDAIDGRVTSLYSPPFYTAKNGYKMCVRVYLNGDGMGNRTHLSLFFILMKGEFDALLKWPFDHKVSLILVDQNRRKHLVQTFKPTPESSSFQRPISDMNVAYRYPRFCELSVLDDDSYTKGDVLFIKCIVDTSHFCSVYAPENEPEWL